MAARNAVGLAPMSIRLRCEIICSTMAHRHIFFGLLNSFTKMGPQKVPTIPAIFVAVEKVAYWSMSPTT